MKTSLDRQKIAERLKGQDITPTTDCTTSYLLGYVDAKKEIAEPPIHIERVRVPKRYSA